MEEQLNLIEKVQNKVLPIDQLEDITSNGLKPAAVLIPLILDQGQWKLLFIHRSNKGVFHKGEVAFPGGARESKDGNLADTALRETFEELGIPNDKVRILGFIRPFPTVSNYLVTPIIGVIEWPLRLVIEEDEVERVFSIPLDWLKDLSNWTNRDFVMLNGEMGNTIFYKSYDNEVLWGITARMTIELVDGI